MIAAGRVPAPAAAAFAAGVTTAAGAGISGNQRLTIGLPLLLAGFGLACVSAYRARRPSALVTPWWIADALAVMAAIAVVLPPRDHPPLWYEIVYRAVPATGLIASGLFAAGGRAARAAVWGALVLVVALQAVTPLANPSPHIDVWSWTDTAVGAFLRGVHPYVVRAADIYRGGFMMGYRNTVYPYMPLTVIANVPSTWLLHDYRFGLALCLPATVVLVRAAGRRLGVESAFVDAITLVLVFAPCNTYLVASGYNEPLLLTAAALFVYAVAVHPVGVTAATSFMLMPALKQYVLAPPLLFAVDRWRRGVWRPLLAGSAIAAATVVPFLVWNWRATLDGIVFQVNPSVAFRTDSISVTALVALATGVTPWHWLPEATQLAIGAAAYWWLRDAGTAGLLLASAIAVDASFLLGTQAFTNYYAFVVMLFLMAALLLARRDGAAV